jgi:hypothetical protein
MAQYRYIIFIKMMQSSFLDSDENVMVLVSSEVTTIQPAKQMSGY